MFGSNSPTSPMDFFLPCNLMEPVFFDCDQQYQQVQMSSSETDCLSSPPQTPDVISGLISMSVPISSPSDVSTSSYGDVTSPEDNQMPLSPPSTSYMPCPGTVPSVQATRSKLIKEGLKLTIQSRRMVHGLANARSEYRQPSQETLTHEDVERRKRRRERNKVAATKCRNKKKERTKRLAVESDDLEVNNGQLRKEIDDLERERKELADLLSGHVSHCCLPSSRSACAHAYSGPNWSSFVMG